MTPRPRRVAVLLGLAAAAVGCGGSSSGGDPLAPPATFRLLEVQAQVFSPRCGIPACHVGEDAPFGLDLSAAALTSANAVGVTSAEMPSLLRIEPGNAADSYLYMKLTGDENILGDPMPFGGPPLGAADLEMIRTWIDEGAPQ